jgi:hypothetical protein
MIAGHVQRGERAVLQNVFRICPITNDRARARPMTPLQSRVSDPSELGNQLKSVSTKAGQFHYSRELYLPALSYGVFWPVKSPAAEQVSRHKWAPGRIARRMFDETELRAFVRVLEEKTGVRAENG